VWIALVSFCVVAALAILGVAVLRWWRNPEFLRWIRIEKRARTREAAARVAARYASLPSITVKPPLEPAAPPASLAGRKESAA
jgi:hypothetical protein